LEGVPTKHSIPAAPWAKWIVFKDERIVAAGNNPNSPRIPIHEQNPFPHRITCSFFLLEVNATVLVVRPHSMD
jgi:hypothetical protein